MAENKHPQTVELVAVERGFRNGNLVEPGTRFPFEATDADGKPRKLPKWAARPGDPRIGQAKRTLTAADLKPPAAETAARQKIEQARDLAG